MSFGRIGQSSRFGHLGAGGTLKWLLGSSLGTPATIDMYFQAGKYFGRDPTGLTVSRASTGYANDPSGNWISFASNVARITGNGLLVEESRTNGIRNNSMQGAVAGTPGTVPTNWSIDASGLTTSVVGTGTANGIDYIDISLSGTTGANYAAIAFDGNSNIAAAQGQTWNQSAFLAVVGGSLTNVSSLQLITQEYTAGGSYLQNDNAGGTFTPTATLSRYSGSMTLSNASVGNLHPLVQFNWSPGVSVNITLRIGWPQIENNSNINSTVASATTQANGASGVNGSGVYQVGGGTGTAATLNVTWAAGVLTVNSVANAGSYTVFPPSPATLTYVSGTATGWTGATVNLTPTNLSAQAFATSPIRTTSAAATRAADVVSLTSAPAFGSSVTAFAKGTPQAPAAFATTQAILEVSDGTFSNRIGLFRDASNGTPDYLVVSATVTQAQLQNGTWSQNTSGKFAGALAAGSQQAAFNSTLTAAGTGANAPSGLNTVRFGGSPAAGLPWNGFVERIALWPSTKLANATLQSITT